VVWKQPNAAGVLDAAFLSSYAPRLAHMLIEEFCKLQECPCDLEVFIFNLFYLENAAKMWCYCRMVYMPMSYLYGKRFVGPITPLILQFREEPYHEINWKGVRHLCAKVSLT
jgi:hypothetical protein